ncbi:TIGR00375 family protein [Aquibacillus halophilus]|uniref:TIGR00375 family protein n=1 Tax=Aquibacillus halophilus TaxID=930132 RepID=A0A6A8DHF1_9BACI|nr:endonuclease Q family protein [Aquibacillus halophilus]MRH42327.1 TIGR00375 family protein [Aquibacillus halophilus]
MFNKPVKITGSKALTLTNILQESSRNKGIDIVGVIDSHAPAVLMEIEELIVSGSATELTDGGIQFENVTLILGSEIEVYDQTCRGPIHVLCYMPNLSSMKKFSKWLSTKMKNINLSSQRYYGTGKELQVKVKELNGLFIPAHVFTPYKSLYGKGVNQSLTEVFDETQIDAIELGLSSDTIMADQISELHNYTFVTNSDAHSLAKIAREYQEIRMKEPTFKELSWALHQIHAREIKSNYGMNPLLGKYHNSVCRKCLNPNKGEDRCEICGSVKVTKGVADRISELRDNFNPLQRERPPYIYQVPLEYIPSLGPKTFEKLLNYFGTEMKIIHKVPEHELDKVAGPKITNIIIKMRAGELRFQIGGGGRYGKLL